MTMTTLTLFDLQIKVIKGEFNTNEALYVTPSDEWVSVCQAYATYLEYNQSEFKKLGMNIKYGFFINLEKAKAFFDEKIEDCKLSDNCELKLRIVEKEVVHDAKNRKIELKCKKGKADKWATAYLDWEGRSYDGPVNRDINLCLDRIIKHATGPIQWLSWDVGIIFAAPSPIDVNYMVRSGQVNKVDKELDKELRETLNKNVGKVVTTRKEAEEDITEMCQY